MAKAGASGTKAAKDIETGFEKASQSTRRFNASAAALGSGLASATMLMGNWTRAAAEDAAAQARLEQAVTNTGASLDQYSQKLDAAIRVGQRKAFSDDMTRDALVKLNLVTNDTQKSLDQLGLVMDFARAKGISLSTSAEVIAKVYGGNLGILSRYGIILDENATKEQALALIQQRTAGQARSYADSDVGQLARRKDQLDELTESWGAHAGALQEVLMLMPGLQAGYSAVAGILAGLGGAGALAAIAPVLAGGLALGGAAAYAYSLNTGGRAENTTAGFLAGAAGMFGLSDVENQFQGIVDANNLVDATNSIFYTPPGANISDKDRLAIGRLKNSGVLPYSFEGDAADAAEYISKRAKALGMTTASYIDRKVSQSPSYVFDAGYTGQYVQGDTYTQLDRERRLEALGVTSDTPATRDSMYQIAYGMGRRTPFDTAGWLRGSGLWEFGPGGQAYAMGGTGAVANGLLMGGRGQYDAGQMEAIRDSELVKMLGGQFAAFKGEITGQGGGRAAFEATQNIILERQQVYTGQASTYSGQEQQLTAARDILLQRQAEGIKLSKEEQDLLDKYPELYSRVTGGIEDATVAAGVQAAKYIENMQIGDQLNQTNQDLNRTIQDLILSLNSVPEEVRTAILLDRADESVEDLIRYYNWLNLVSGTWTTVIQTQFVEGSGGTPGRVRGRQHGGVVGAAHGRFIDANYTLVGEAGPELMVGGQGSMVIPASASRADKRGRGGGGLTINNHGPVNYIIQGNNERQALRTMQQAAIASVR